MVGHLDK